MKNRFTPNYAVPPGETLLESIEKLGMSQAQLAQRMGRPLKTNNEIINDKAAITAETALQLVGSAWNLIRLEYSEELRTWLPVRQWVNETVSTTVTDFTRTRAQFYRLMEDNALPGQAMNPIR